VVQSVIAVSEGRVPDNIVNREVIDSPRFQEKLAAFRAR
jgi:hypothetical protein